MPKKKDRPESETHKAADLPLKTEAFDVIGIPPTHGWWHFFVVTDEHAVPMQASHVFDPVFDLVTWLEGLTRNDFARLEIDEQGSVSVFSLEPVDEGVVRLQIGVKGGARLDCDCLVEKKELISKFYKAIRAMSDDGPRYFKHWLKSDENASEWAMSGYKSDLLESYL